ncbi:hypothetical protein [Aminipila terrae]|uniref:Uncharacterized protein n=1 Tax=Aminipila terrae TaxID=2697030 RepID=A0A6P1MHS0_9FIRM|nr:hypothetical protein [Aminipila terrae]QHI73437.1 hypothetical protein Ami3637_14585 [Aminipila terrae]
MDARDSEKMVKLAKEGKEISKILQEDFPQYTYWDIYWEVYGSGEKTSMGVRRMITNRLNKIVNLQPMEQRGIIDEIDELVWHLYDRYKESQQKLDDIRSIIGR